MKTLFKIFVLLLAALSSHAQLIYETVWVDYDSAIEYKSLQFIPIRPKDPAGKPGPRLISLSKAIETGVATLSERGSASTENVHWLRVNNKSENSIFVASGQTLNGGRQDRMVTRDTILNPTGGDQYIQVMCIEENRWSEKEKKIQYGNYANTQLRQVLDKTKNQVLIWKEIFSQLGAANLNSPTFAYAAISQNKEFQVAENEYLDFFRKRFKNSDSTMTGFICVSGNKVLGCEIFADKSLFYDELEPLLFGYINEAIMRGSQPMLVKEQIKEFTDKILTNETLQAEYCKTKGKIFRANNRVVQVTAY
ncbi:MAG: hypothetical protein JNK79_13760 [Chitinophagaceae bacterium]|nr:hypothetical protein [Chitinophagaceae bacterium]